MSAREACVEALAKLSRGRSPLIEPAQHGIAAAQLVEIARAVRLEARSAVRVAWSDGAVRYVSSAQEGATGATPAAPPFSSS
jgi:hypothetical protein